MSRQLSDQCLNCHAHFDFDKGNNDGAKGRIYSEAGVREAKISGLCETCFDAITAPIEEDDDYEDDTSPPF